MIPPEAVAAADLDMIVVAPCGLALDATRQEVALLEEQGWWCAGRGGAAQGMCLSTWDA